MKNKFKLSIPIFLIFSLICQGCGKKDAAIEAISKNNPNPAIINPVETTKYFAPYTGEEVKKEISENIAIMAVVENSKEARPQSGLNSADIVFETMAEGGIPRFIALFQKNTPDKIGPIRSARNYFIDISKEYNLPFGHCGGSEEALSKIKQENLMSMNEMAYGTYYWRDKVRKAPHNLYTSAEKLRNLAKSKGYVNAPIVKLSFDKSYWNSDKLSPGANVLLKVNKYYNTGYVYKDGFYLKSMDGKASLNKEDSAEIKIVNIVIQLAQIELQKDGSHLDIALIGHGDGYVISNGKFIKMKWSKKDINSQTLLKDENDKTIPLNPGNTWWHIIDLGTPIEIK